MNNDGQPRQLQDTDGPQQWYDSLPFVTKHWLTTSVLTTFFTNFGIIPIDKVYYSFGAVKDKFEIWRLITNFAYVGPFEFNTVAYLFMLYKYSANYESSSGYNTGSGGGTADYVFMLLFGALVNIVIGAIYPIAPFYSGSLIAMIMYIGCKRDPTTMVSIMGYFSIPAMYVPMLFLAVQIVTAQANYLATIQGFMIGHLYYFLAEAVPSVHGKTYLVTPDFLISKLGIGEYTPPRPSNGMDAAAPNRGLNARNAPAPAPTSRHTWGSGGQALGRS